MRKLNTFLGIAALLLLTMVSGCRQTASQGPQVRIDINVPLTGPIAAWSGQFPNGFKMGIEDASKQYNVPSSVFSVDVQDNAGQPAQALSIFNKQQLQGFQTYISVTTGTANAIAPQLDTTGIPHFIAAFDPFITQPSTNRMRLMANSKVEAPVVLDYVKKVQAHTVYIVQLNFSYAEEECGRIIQPTLEGQGVKVVREKYELDQRDFKNVVQKIKAARPDVIFFVGYSFHIQPFLRDLKAAALLKRGRLVTSMDFVDLVFSGVPASDLQDAYFVSPIFNIQGLVQGADTWKQRFHTRFGVEPTYVPAYAYDNAQLIVRAYAQAKKIDVPSLLAAAPFDGVNGAIRFDKDRDVIATVDLAQVNDSGSVVLVK